MANEQTTAKPETAIHREPRETWFEFIAAAILGLATLGSAWSGYQSGLWGGIQDFRIAESLASGRNAAENAVYANQLRLIDVVSFERYVSAVSENNKQLSDFLVQRFRPEFKPAFDAWVAMKPLENAAAPPSPFVMKEYSLAPEREAQQLRQLEEKKTAEASKANTNSDTYLLLTVLFSVVLFLAGITAAFERRKLQMAVLSFSIVILTGASIALALLPLAKE
jgi:ABC-type multidrug transport system fused ATPase/permease subunit